MLAASVALVAVRIWAGRGARDRRRAVLHPDPRHADAARVAAVRPHAAALPALPRRGAGGRGGRAARRAATSRSRSALLAGVGIGTLGLAAEWAWSYAWWTIEWPASMLVEGVDLRLRGRGGRRRDRRASSAARSARPRSPRSRCRASRCRRAVVAIVAVLVYATPITAGDPVKASVTLTDAKPPPKREVNLHGQARPARRGRDAYWFVADRLAGQGGRARSSRS